MKKEIVTVADFEKEMDEIEVIQNRVAEILSYNFFWKWLYLREAQKL